MAFQPFQQNEGELTNNSNDHFYLIDRFALPTKIDFLFEGLIPRLGVGLLWGQSTVGKTLLGMRIAAALATGAPLVINPDDPHEGRANYRGVTLYFYGEGVDGYGARATAIEEAIGDYMNELPDGMEYLPIIPIGIRHRLQEAAQIPAIMDAVAHKVQECRAMGYDVRLLIFDTLIACFDIQDDNNNSEMQRIVAALKVFGHRFDCFVLGVCHPGKPRDGREISIRGAGSPKNSADLELQLQAINGSMERELIVKKLRDGGPAGHRFRLRVETFQVRPPLSRYPYRLKTIARRPIKPYRHSLQANNISWMRWSYPNMGHYIEAPFINA